MNYYEMLKAAQKNGTANEKTMWESVASVSALLDEIKDSHKDLYWSFMREQYGIMSGGHYDKFWSDWDVSQMYSTNKEGRKCEGEIISLAESEELSRGWTPPSGTTKYDVYVAMNAMAHDLGKSFDKEHIAKATKCFYFSDEDWTHKEAKIWRYMNMVHDHE